MLNTLTKRAHIFLIIYSILLLVSFERIIAIGVVTAQENQWSIPRKIPGYHNEAQTPLLVTDRNRTVHAFNSTWVGDKLAVVYSQWQMGRGWTPQTDIILPLSGQNRVEGVHLDENGLAHLIYFGGDDLDGSIYYSRALITDAVNAHSWITPKTIGKNAITPNEAAIVGDVNGRHLNCCV